MREFLGQHMGMLTQLFYPRPPPQEWAGIMTFHRTGIICSALWGLAYGHWSEVQDNQPRLQMMLLTRSDEQYTSLKSAIINHFVI